MFALIAVVAFLLALIQDLTDGNWGRLSVSVLTIAGLLFIALHLVNWSALRAPR